MKKNMKSKSEIDLSIFSEALGVDITQRTRKREVALSRFVVFLKLCISGLTRERIGDMFGMSHSSVSYGIKEVRMQLEAKDKLVTGLWNKVKDLKI